MSSSLFTFSMICYKINTFILYLWLFNDTSHNEYVVINFDQTNFSLVTGSNNY